MTQHHTTRFLTGLIALCLIASPLPLAASKAADSVDLSPSTWQADYDAFMAQQLVDRERAGVATGKNGAVTVAYNALAARAGLEALKQGGNAIDALLTTALAQVVLTAGAPISYFGTMSLVYYDAESETVHTMDAAWNTLLEETEPMSIPGGLNMSTPEGLRGRDPSGRTALVGGFMKGVGAAHERFGKLPFAQLFAPSIHIAEDGFPISEKMAGYWDMRAEDLARLPETSATLLKPGAKPYVAGDVLRQPALAKTLRAVAEQGADYMYTGPWAKQLVDAVRADGGKMTLEDLERYDVLWREPIIGKLGNGWEIATNPPPNTGGVAMIEAQQLAIASGMFEDGHWTKSGTALRKALDITQLYVIDFLPNAARTQMFPGVDFSATSRITLENAKTLWQHAASGKRLVQFEEAPKHSDDVVVIDKDGNIAAITQSINCVLWGKTAIVVDGVTIGDPASFQQMQIARAGPGNRLDSPTETGILFKDGEPVLGFASMGSGLHYRAFQGLANVIHFGMTVDEAIDSPDFFSPTQTAVMGRVKATFPEAGYSKEVLDEMGYSYVEIDPKEARFGGEGIWVAISRDPETGELRAASHNRNNSAAVAF